jgi:predicted RNase H-like nuclease (RuvC/YqgF family)
MADDKECTDIKVEVGVLKTKVELLTSLCNKMDKVIDKLSENQDRMVEQIYVDMRKREDDKNQDVKELHSRITTISRELSDKVELTERRIMDEIKSLRQDIAEHNKKEDTEIKKILEWKWMAAGGIIVMMWLITNVDFAKIASFFN